MTTLAQTNYPAAQVREMAVASVHKCLIGERTPAQQALLDQFETLDDAKFWLDNEASCRAHGPNWVAAFAKHIGR